MVPALPALSGSPDWVGSSAWIWAFSSTESTTACLGGSTYRPTMSSSLAANSGSVERLKARIRCGCRSSVCHIRCTERSEIAASLAIARPVQWVASPGGSEQVRLERQ